MPTRAIEEYIAQHPAGYRLLHVLPTGFHRIRHYGLFANSGRAENVARARQLLNAPATPRDTGDADGTDEGGPPLPSHPCPCCGGRMIVIETFERGRAPRYQSTVPIRIDSS
jgi:Putative transposase